MNMDSDTDITMIKGFLTDYKTRCHVQDAIIESKQKEIENKDRIIRVLNKRLKGLEIICDIF